MKKTMFKKIISTFLVLFLTLSPLSNQALADFDWPSPSDAAKEAADGIANKYGINQNTIVESAQSFNVAKNKKQPPQVYLTFSPTNPIPGEKVTANAEPLYFGNNDSSSMYFTWYLRHRDELEKNSHSDLENFKVRAARIIASDNFQYEDGYSSDSDNDGYKAVMGGDDQRNVGKESHCFFHDMEKGSEYEFRECRHLFPNAPGKETGDNSFGLEEEEFWKTNPNDSDTADLGQTDEATVSGLGQKSFSWTYQEGDQIGVVIEGISYEPTAYNDASYKVMWALPKNKCELTDDAFDDPSEGTDEEIVVSPEIWPSCPDGCSFTRTVTKKTTTYDQAPTSSYQIGTTVTTTKTETIQLNSQQMYVTGTGETTTTDGGTTETSLEIGTEYTDLPEPPSNEECYLTDELTGATITDRSCCPAGNENCSVLSSRTETTNPGSKLEVENNEDVNLFKMTLDDFDKCLLQNFVDPTEGGGKYKKINVSLSYDPKNPINDPAYTNSDQLTVSSSIPDATDAEFLYYTWQVWKGNSIDGPWGDPLTKNELTNSTSTLGAGIKDLKFDLNFKDATYLRVKLTVSEKAYNGERKGHDEVIIPLVLNKRKIEAYLASVSNDDNLNLSLGKQICLNKNNEDDPICKVAKNQIIAVKINDDNLTNFNWSVDGKAINYNYTNSTETPKTAYFPVKQEKNKSFSVSLSAIDKETGEKVNLTKAFEVSDPTVQIVSENEGNCAPSLLGYYIDSNNKEWPDYSKNDFQAKKDTTVSLKAKFNVATPNADNITWNINGNKLVFGETVNFSAEKDYGQTYNVSVSSLYSQDNATVKALSKYWGISYDGLYEKKIATTAKITITTSDSELEDAKAKKFLASIISEVPGYLSFLIRIILTVAVLLFVIKITFLLIKKTIAKQHYD